MEAGAGGVILCPDGKVSENFPWGLGVTKNNQKEELGLCQGLRLKLVEGIFHLSIFGDYLITIHKGINWSKNKDHDLSPTMQRIILLMEKFEFVYFFLHKEGK